MADRLENLSHLVTALSKRGIAQSIIGFYVQRWEAVTQASATIPCPFCFFGGHSGTLAESSEQRADGCHVLRCGRCDQEIEVPGA